jgi:hypothetical protein
LVIGYCFGFRASDLEYFRFIRQSHLTLTWLSEPEGLRAGGPEDQVFDAAINVFELIPSLIDVKFGKKKILISKQYVTVIANRSTKHLSVFVPLWLNDLRKENKE